MRLCLDVNVWYSFFDGLTRNGRTDTAASALVEAITGGSRRFGPVQLVISHAMLDTLERVLARKPHLVGSAADAREAVEALCVGGTLGLPPSLVLGGTASMPMLDEEDAHVLSVALASDADLLVTGNRNDFVGGSRTALTTEELAKDRRGEVDVIMLRHPRAPHGLTIASIFRAAAWLGGSVSPPPRAIPRLLR